MRRMAFVIGMVACGVGTLAALAADRGVRIDDNFYDPAKITITPGTTVVWEHTGSASHSVTSQPGSPSSFDSSPNCSSLNFLFCLRSGERFRVTLNTVGTYTYYCRVHGSRSIRPDPEAGSQEQPCGMCGTIVVRRRSSPKPSPTSQLSPTAAPTAAPTAGPTTTATPSVAPTIGPSASPSPSPSAERTVPRGAIAAGGIVGLLGIAYGIWRFLIAPR